jgi:hypothetical protein
LEISREYLEGQLANLTKQAEQAAVTLHNANGAIAATRHLLEVIGKDEPPVMTIAEADVAAASAEQPQEATNDV